MGRHFACGSWVDGRAGGCPIPPPPPVGWDICESVGLPKISVGGSLKSSPTPPPMVKNNPDRVPFSVGDMDWPLSSFGYGLDLFAPPPMPRVPPKKVKGQKPLPSAPPVAPTTSTRRTRSTIPHETDLLEVGDWLADKDTLCWLNQELLRC